MAYNTVAIKKDVETKPVPQYFNPTPDGFEVLMGRNGANRVEIYGPDGNPISVVSGKIAIRAEEIEVKLAGGLPGALTSGGGLKAGLVDAIPAGNNNIGDVDIASALPAGTNTIGGIKVVGNDTPLQGNITLTGTAQQLAANQSSKNVTIQAEPTNSGYVYIGLSTVSDTVHMATLSPGSSMTFYVSNLNLLYVRGTSGDKVCYGGEA